ncbi:hypothetical protein [Candidatus Similichlamydia laticola]|uniref:Uncharacterized protein n=1 Tax=Candidatus Similichlamydia laticola TaxID=2170265 RepID=A0A369KKE7_9BACT|nr:hypothetical protein [Candidatus Similichlamydia laticola]RDB31476.1 hypothetical protein HAT2_00422 [Candidatus Similichlamydia laticola]
MSFLLDHNNGSLFSFQVDSLDGYEFTDHNMRNDLDFHCFSSHLSRSLHHYLQLKGVSMKKLYGYLALGTCMFLTWYFPSVLLSARKPSSRLGGCFTLQIEPGEIREHLVTLPARSILRIEIPNRVMRNGLNWRITIPPPGVLSLKNQGVSKNRKKGASYTFLEFECGSSGHSEVNWSYKEPKQKGQDSVLRVEIMPRPY